MIYLLPWYNHSFSQINSIKPHLPSLFNQIFNFFIRISKSWISILMLTQHQINQGINLAPNTLILRKNNLPSKNARWQLSLRIGALLKKLASIFIIFQVQVDPILDHESCNLNNLIPCHSSVFLGLLVHISTCPVDNIKTYFVLLSHI